MTNTEGFVLRGGDSWRDPFASYRWLRDHDPVHRVIDPVRGDYWVLSRFDAVFDAVRDTTTYSSAQGLTPEPAAMDMFGDMAAPIVMMDPPDHTVMRRAVSRPMTPRNVQPFEPAVTAFVDERLDRIGADEVDIVELLFKPLPSFAVAHYLGVPESDFVRFDAWTQRIVAANADGDIANAGDPLMDLLTYAGELIERKQVEPGDDLISDLLQSGTAAATPMWIVGFIFTMVTGGNDTVTGLLGGAAELLCAYPDQRAELLTDPDLVPDTVEELLRLTSPVQNLARTTTAPVVVDGVEIPADQKVMLHYGAANRDDREFGADADDFVARRAPRRILSLGYGAHHCLGAAVARMQGRVVLQRLLERFPAFSVDAERGCFADGPYVRRYESLPFIAG